MRVNREGSVPLYKQIYDKVKNDILDRRYNGGDLLPSERELSGAFEVDRITVRRSLEMLVQDGLVEKLPGLGTRVRELPQDATAVSSAMKNILFALPKSISSIDRITEPFNSSLFYHIEIECQKKGYCLTYTTLSEHDNLSGVFNGNRFAGIIFVSNIDERFYMEARELGIPSVLVNNQSDGFPSMMIDNEKGAYAAVSLLTAAGHARIGMIQGKPGYITSAERFEGYKRALADAGIHWSEQPIKAGDWTLDGGYKAMKEILEQERGQLPTAIFAANDTTAFGAYQAIKEAGLSIPHDISIVGFDNVEQSEFLDPKLTTVNVDTDVLGKAACQYLFNSIDTGEILNLKVVIPASVIERSSAVRI